MIRTRLANHSARSTSRAPSRRRAFTLLESALATVIVGVGVLALVEAQNSFSRSNEYSTSSATGAYIANELRERMRHLPRHDPVTGLFIQVSGSTSTLNGWGPETGEVIPADYNDIDDFNGKSFGLNGTFAGPIDANNRVINQMLPTGVTETNDEGAPISMRGWKQSVRVEKVDPFNYALVRDAGFFVAPNGSNPGIAIDAFPLRVTVTVTYQGPLDLAPQEMARVVWLVP